MWIIIAAILWILIAFTTGVAADNRGRSQWGGILLGFLLGPLGLAIVLLLPEGPAL